MAEKEERIRVLLAKNPCKECSVKKCTRKCMFGLLFEKAPGMTRTEAIDKISRALFKHEAPIHMIYENMPDVFLESFRKKAGIALDGIMEKR